MKMEKKVFGYPEFNAEGEQVLTTYDNEYRDMLMDIRVYRMKAGTTRSFSYGGEETAVLLLSGELTFAWEGQEKTVTRKDVFTEGPWAVHVSSGVEVKVTAVADSEILVQRTKNEKAFAAKLYAPEDAPWKYSAVGKFGNVAKRRVNTIFDHDISIQEHGRELFRHSGRRAPSAGGGSGLPDVYLLDDPPSGRKSVAADGPLRR